MESTSEVKTKHVEIKNSEHFYKGDVLESDETIFHGFGALFV